MVKPLRDHETIENLRLLADWLLVKYPGEHFELVVAGGSAMTLDVFKDQTIDIDLLRPEVLPSSIKNGIANIGRVKKLGPEWPNTSLVNHQKLKTMFKTMAGQHKSVIFEKISQAPFGGAPKSIRNIFNLKEAKSEAFSEAIHMRGRKLNTIPNVASASIMIHNRLL
jgi:hypothetical protein